MCSLCFIQMISIQISQCVIIKYGVFVISPLPVFCMYYIIRGVLQENRQELIVFVLCVFLVMVRSIVNFSVLKEKEKLLVVHQPSFQHQQTTINLFLGCSGFACYS